MKKNFPEKNNIQQLKDKIEALEKTVSKLKKSEQLVTNAVYYAPIGMITLAIDGKFNTVNKAFCQITGYTKKELLTLKISQITHPDDIHIGNSVIKKLTSGKAKNANFEKRYIHKKGNTIHAQVSTVILRDALGTPINFFTQVIDITMRKQTEDALQESEKRYKHINNELEAIMDHLPILVFYKDKKGNYLRVNKYVADSHHMSKEELTNKSTFDLYPKDQAQAYLEDDLEVIESGESKLFIEEPWETEEGKKWVSTSKIPFVDKHGDTLGIIGISIDITERKRAEEEKKAFISDLMEREEKYRTLTQNLNVGVYRSTPGKNSMIIEANPTFLKMFGFRSKDELERWKTVDFYHNPPERKRIEKKLISKGFLINEEVKLRKKDGSIFFASISSTAAKDELGKVIHYDGIIEDITERKEMMERILQERDRSQLYLDIAGVMFLAFDRKGNIILANQKTCEIIGTTEKYLIGKNWFDNYLPQDIRLNVKNDIYNIMNGNAELAEYYEHEILTTSGEKRLIAWRNSTLKDESGKIFGIISSGLDITKSKEDEELRNKLYETSRNLTESLDVDEVLNRISKQAMVLLKCSSVMVYMLDDDKVHLSPVFAYDPPYTEKVLATKLMIDNSLTGQVIKAKIGKIFNYGNNIKGAFHIKGTPKTDTDNIIISPFKIDGEVIGALNLIRSELPFTNKDLSIVKTFAVYASTAIKNANSHKALLYEIDERKKTETQLKESHDRYESIFNGAVDGIVYSDWEGKILSVNLAFTKLIGMKKADLIGKNGTQLVKQLLPKKSMMKKLKFIKNTVLKGEALKGLPIEYNNKSLEFYTRKEKGKPGVTVMVRDVTERNKARKNVELHQNNLATLSNELLVTEEEAKRRLATTLHDKLGQYLVLAKFKTDELNKKTADSENKKIIDEITSFIEEAINESRNITYELSPPILYEMGLIPAISLKLDDIEKSNEVKTSLIDQSKSYELEEKVQIILYRGINELLQNVLKHSKAESVNVSFKLLTNDYRITVRDNGIGLDLEAMRNKAVSQKKFGLFSIMERIKYIGGSVKIDTKPRKGTKVVINLPIKNL